MDLDKYLYQNGRKSIRLSEEVECTKHTISNVRTKKFTPNLLTALKIVILSGGQISMEELLKQQDKEIFDNWIEKNSLEYSYRVHLSAKKPHSSQ